MAIAFVTSASTGNGTAVSTFTVAKPASLTDGCTMWLAVTTNNVTTTNSQTKNTDSTWTRLSPIGLQAPTANIGCTLFRRYVATASSEPATYAFSIVQTDDTTAMTVTYGYAVIALSGVDTTTPEDAALPAWTLNDQTSAATIDSTATTTVTDNAWALAVAAEDFTTAFTAPAGYGNLTQTSVGKNAAWATKDITPAGAVTAATWTMSSGTTDLMANHVLVRPLVIVPGIAAGTPSWPFPHPPLS